MRLYKASSLAIDCDEAHRKLYMTCLSTLVSSEFREGLMAALDCAENYHIKLWLLDLREIGELDEKEAEWLHQYFFPSIMSKLGTGNYMAMVLSEKCYNILLHEAGKYGLRSYNEVIIMKNFFDLAEADTWLNTKAPHLA